MKTRNLRSLSYLVASLVTTVSTGIPSQVQADTTLPPIEVIGPDCGRHGIPVFQGDAFLGCFNGDLGGGGPSAFWPPWLGGGGGGQISNNPTDVPSPYIASGSCSDEAAEGKAGNVFRSWKLATDKNASLVSAPDHKAYTVTFADHRSQTYIWGLPLQAGLPLQIDDGKCN